MKAKALNLSWIVAKDLKKAIEFYTDVIGLKLVEMHDQFGWAELEGHEGGARLGIAQQDKVFQAGDNACITITVENLEKAKENLLKKGTKCIGEIQKVPGHVKLQMVVDLDGNHMQLVEMLS